MDFVVVNSGLALEARDGRVEVAHVGGVIGSPVSRVHAVHTSSPVSGSTRNAYLHSSHDVTPLPGVDRIGCVP